MSSSSGFLRRALRWICILPMLLVPSLARASAVDAETPQPEAPVQSKPLPDMMCKVPEPGTDELLKDARIKAQNDKLKENSQDREALEMRGKIYADKRAYTLALADFDAAIRLGSNEVEIFNDRCFVRGVLGDLTGAAQDCEGALRLKPNQANILDTRGFVRLKSGQMERAIEDFDSALKIDPKLVDSLYARGIAKIRIGDTAGGEADLHAARDRDSLVGNTLAEIGVPDPHPEWGLSGVVHISKEGEVTISNGFEINGTFYDTRKEYKPGDAGYQELLRHLCGLKPGEQKFFRPWRR
jgi:tetratricopeptide (TPR) repeat protein